MNVNKKVVVKSFSGATTACMEQYIKPSLRQKPNELIIHTGTNDLSSNKTPSQISKSIIDLAVTFANLNTKVAVSSINQKK